MINTYNDSLHPPPVPPRYGGQSLVRNQTGAHTRLLSAAFVVQAAVTVVLFIYLFQRIDTVPQTEGKVDSLSVPGQHSGSGTLAQMKVQQPSGGSRSKTLCWNWDHSTLKNVDYFPVRRMLHIRLSGYYYVYSQVTFSKRHPRIPLVQSVMRRRGAEDAAGEDLLFKAFCSLGSGEICTSYHGGVVHLEEGQRLYVNVTDLSLVNFDVTTTTFGLFLLQHTP
ncbi:hypothetical protein AAFF_G00101630 [Aldrovandia affinis]|uniref:THD domain-containing protein n=1 Tax=Aldrovandia affinis TaxID=143900 RepID=A0AAD7RUH5_9TELE|nr:hypothetical protein AAFF_G00101630 [Aldrovandia affinis]